MHLCEQSMANHNDTIHPELKHEPRKLMAGKMYHSDVNKHHRDADDAVQKMHDHLKTKGFKYDAGFSGHVGSTLVNKYKHSSGAVVHVTRVGNKKTSPVHVETEHPHLAPSEEEK